MLEVGAILGLFFAVNLALGLLGVVGALPVILIMRLRHGADCPSGAQFVAAVATGITVGWAVGVAYTLVTIYVPWDLEIVGMYPVLGAVVIAGAAAAVIVGAKARRPNT
ncbi:MAG: hypothetical protein KDB26_15800 [Microthrixaceae bacterium]|nr:hypothetical protein [Microthrixaceae bacterium]